LKEHLELELEERGQVDDVLNFFMGSGGATQVSGGPSTTSGGSFDFLDDEQFYKPMNMPASGGKQAAAASNEPNQINTGFSREEQGVIDQIQRNVAQSKSAKHDRNHDQATLE